MRQKYIGFYGEKLHDLLLAAFQIRHQAMLNFDPPS